MTQEDKQLLFRDLCARLPYKPKVLVMEKKNGKEKVWDDTLSYYNLILGEMLSNSDYLVLPYLKPLTKLTEKNFKELKQLCSPQGTATYQQTGVSTPLNRLGEFFPYQMMENIIKYLDKNQFDHRGLINKDLALELKDVEYE